MRRFTTLVAGAVAIAACERGPTVAVRLVHPLQATPGYPPSYLVEVEHQGRRDTIAGVRVLFAPTVRGSTVTGIGVTNIFTYDASTGRLVRAGLPRWFEEELTPFAVPALSPDGRHLAYLSWKQDGRLEARVRSWPGGEIVAQGPPAGEATGAWHLGRVTWIDNARFTVEYDERYPGRAVRVLIRGSVGDPTFGVDTLASGQALDSLRATARTAADSSTRAAARAAADSATRAAAESAAPERLAYAALVRRFDSAALHIRRLSPNAFPQLPAGFGRELEALGCTIPQSDYAGSVPGNVIRGQFGAKGQDDWAALCSRDGVSVILVHWGGRAWCPREIQSASDKSFLQTLGGGRIGFSRGIQALDRVYAEAEDSSGTGYRLVTLEHDGIDDAFQGKASTVWFCRGGKWIALAGAD